jgi:serine O-acetyltransferase
MKTGRSRENWVCMGDALERRLCGVVASLRGLYNIGDEDRPDSLLRSGPNAARVVDALRVLLDLMFPGRVEPADIGVDELGIFLLRRMSRAWRLLRPEVEKAIPFRWRGAAARAERTVRRREPHAESVRILKAFVAALPRVRQLLVEDVKAAYEGDPAALTYAEVQLAYPGLLAIASHRIAHELYRLDVPVVPRIMSEWTHAQTGVDIHPGARIGHGFFVDHATGVVIGETTEIGHRVKLYQGVTLGARSFPLDARGHPVKHVKRHPTVEDDVVIYANATILGGDTVIGKGSTVGGNVFLMESVPPHSFVTNIHPELRIQPTTRRAPRKRPPPSSR